MFFLIFFFIKFGYVFFVIILKYRGLLICVFLNFGVLGYRLYRVSLRKLNIDNGNVKSIESFMKYKYIVIYNLYFFKGFIL